MSTQRNSISRNSLQGQFLHDVGRQSIDFTNPNNASKLGSGGGGGGGDNEGGGGEFLHFQLVPIIKRGNHRKHNSHHWFFQGICYGLKGELVIVL